MLFLPQAAQSSLILLYPFPSLPSLVVVVGRVGTPVRFPRRATGHWVVMVVLVAPTFFVPCRPPAHSSIQSTWVRVEKVVQQGSRVGVGGTQPSRSAPSTILLARVGQVAPTTAQTAPLLLLTASTPPTFKTPSPGAWVPMLHSRAVRVGQVATSLRAWEPPQEQPPPGATRPHSTRVSACQHPNT